MAQNIRKYLTKSVVDIAQATQGLDLCGRVASATLTTAVEVGAGNIVRITVTAGAAMHVAFGDATIAAVTAATSPALRLPNSAVEVVYYVLAMDDFIRADVAATRVEVIEA
jgi:hypothetical protein